MRGYILTSLLMGIFFLSAERLNALPSNQIERTYYADKSLREEVGSEIIITCYGRPRGSTLIGRRTRFFTSISESCNTNRNPFISCYLNGRLTQCPAHICESPLVTCR